MEYEKTDDGRMCVRKQETVVCEATYSLSELKEQLATIEAQREREIAQRDIEIAEVQNLIAQAERLGVSK